LAHDNLTYDDLVRIVELIKSSEQFSEFRLKIGEIEVELRRRQGAGSSGMVAPTAAAAGSLPTSSAAAREAGDLIPAHDPTAPAVPAWAPEAFVISAPMVGTVYRAIDPWVPPFVAS